MAGRYRSGKYVPTGRPGIPMVQGPVLFIPFTILINGAKVTGNLTPDQSQLDTAFPIVFMVLFHGIQPVKLHCHESEWKIDGPVEYQGLADQLGYVVIAWYE